MPLLGDPSQAQLTAFLKSASKLLPRKPAAIVCVTGHWEAPVMTVSTSPAPPMLYDYGGFPPEAYKLQYPARGSPQLANRVIQLLKDSGLETAADSKRGYDHGTFVPLMLMFPDADIPVVQVSLMTHMQPGEHIKVGKALAPLRDDNILILGSGSSFHNMRAFMTSMSGLKPDPTAKQQAAAFDEFLQHACCQSSPDERLKLLNAWDAAPGGRFSHPREEHLIPLHVVVGAAGDAAGTAVQHDMLGMPCSSFLFN